MCDCVPRLVGALAGLLMIPRESEQARSSEQPANIAAADYVQGHIESSVLSRQEVVLPRSETMRHQHGSRLASRLPIDAQATTNSTYHQSGLWSSPLFPNQDGQSPLEVSFTYLGLCENDCESIKTFLRTDSLPKCE